MAKRNSDRGGGSKYASTNFATSLSGEGMTLPGMNSKASKSKGF